MNFGKITGAGIFYILFSFRFLDNRRSTNHIDTKQ